MTTATLLPRQEPEFISMAKTFEAVDAEIDLQLVHSQFFPLA